MAYPFGGHPRLREYLEWAQQQGCEVKHTTKDGVSLIKITAPDKGRTVIDVIGDDLSLDTFLLPSQVWYYDRNLNLKSPWPSIDTRG